MKNFQDQRRDYTKLHLDESDLTKEPCDLLATWLVQASETDSDHTAMVLSTSVNNRVSSRVVLLKEIIGNNLVFFTNYSSNKGSQLSSNNLVALNFFWPGCERQVRIEGSATKVSRKESEDYFNSRPYESRIGAMVSQQSKELNNREALDQLYQEMIANKMEAECPVHWGGYNVEINQIEFWQGRANRLHDRFQYNRINKEWVVKRLFP
jgi:pyridoxamine 5'-phosphate oxidase